jgi:hypothetical protein
MLPHVMITTSFIDGIHFVLQSSADQLVCVDGNKTLKFYDFKHDSEKEKALVAEKT